MAILRGPPVSPSRGARRFSACLSAKSRSVSHYPPPSNREAPPAKHHPTAFPNQQRRQVLQPLLLNRQPPSGNATANHPKLGDSKDHPAVHRGRGEFSCGNWFAGEHCRRGNFHPLCQSHSSHCLTHTLHCQSPPISPGEKSASFLKDENYPRKYRCPKLSPPSPRKWHLHTLVYVSPNGNSSGTPQVLRSRSRSDWRNGEAQYSKQRTKMLR